MKRLFTLLLAASAMTGTASAEIVIDDFTGLAPILVSPGIGGAPIIRIDALDDDVAGTRTLTVNAASSVRINNGLFRGFFSEAGGGVGIVTVVYDLATSLDFTSVGLQTLGVDLFRTAIGSTDFDISISDGVGTSTVPTLTIDTPGIGGNLPFQNTDWAGTADLTSINQLSLTFTPNSFGQIESTPNANITAAPEPASMALLGLTGLGGLIGYRRRTRKPAAEAV